MKESVHEDYFHSAWCVATHDSKVGNKIDATKLVLTYMVATL